MLRYLPDKHITRQPEPPKHIQELCSKLGAERLAKEIEQWWHMRGYPQVKAWVEDTPCVGRLGTVYAVRTNLVRGMPPRGGNGAY